MDRETKVFKTPIGNQEVVVKAYLIGREKRALENVFIGQGNNLSIGADSVRGVDAGMVDEAQNTAWRAVIVSIDGKKQGVDGYDVVEDILNMRSADYQFIVKMVNAISNDEDFTQKKTT